MLQDSTISNSQSGLEYDAVVVGAGPAGAFLSYLLSCRGLSVALLDKEELPRYKVCGGGVTRKAARLLDFDISSTFERGPHVGVITMNQQKTLKIPLTEPVAWTVMRDKFDAAIVEKAVGRGAKLFERRRVRQIEGCEVRAENGEVFRGRVIAGADGVISQVARSVGLRRNRSAAAAIECEVMVSDKELARYADSCVFDFGASPYGYGWVFPKQDHLSVGVCTTMAKSQAMGANMDRLLDDYCPFGNVTSRRGHLLPLFSGPEPLVKDRVLLLGDAAGIVDPFTGEGIYYALKSAVLAAEAIAKHLASPSTDLAAYETAVWQTWGRELTLARRVSDNMYRHRTLLYEVFLRNRFIATSFLNVLTGELDYPQFISRCLRSPFSLAAGYIRR